MTIYDCIIIGSGVAGLNAAASFPKNKKILILCKDYSWECNTFYAQGGIAVATDEDDFALHAEDTIKAGAGLCDKNAVEILCKEGPNAIKDLINRGFEFDKDENGNLLYTREAAHSKPRILHAGGDATGRELHLFLMKNNSFPLIYNISVIDLLIKDGICHGVSVCDNKTQKHIYAKNIIIASGGIGSLYKFHTNSRSVSGDLHGICIEKGIELQDMEMTQFHPTVFVKSSYARKQLLTEALRGEGAHIVDQDGVRFLLQKDSRGELSPRDMISRSIYERQIQTGGEIYLSFEMFSKDWFKHRFPTIYYNLQDLGYDLPENKVPISPAFHYCMGGIATDLWGRVSKVKNLYAIGEASRTGVHGANRLASNSLLEGLVFSRRAVEDILDKEAQEENQGANQDTKVKIKEFEILPVKLFKEGDKELKNRLREIMWNSAGIVRRTDKLQEAALEVEQMLQKDMGRLLKLRLLVSKEIIKSALKREKSLGAHYLEG